VWTDFKDELNIHNFMTSSGIRPPAVGAIMKWSTNELVNGHNFLYDMFGRYELQALLAKYDITGICSPRRFRF